MYTANAYMEFLKLDVFFPISLNYFNKGVVKRFQVERLSWDICVCIHFFHDNDGTEGLPEMG
jgi:hypothetical protein